MYLKEWSADDVTYTVESVKQIVSLVNVKIRTNRLNQFMDIFM